MKPYLAIWIALIALVPTMQANAAELGRFFTTPEERNSLDTLRKNSKEEVLKEVASPAPSVAKPNLVSLPENVSMQGFVTRSDGKKGTVWVNHQAMQEGTSNDEVSIGKFGTKNNQVPIEIHANKKTVRLKAGQSYLPSDDALVELGSSPKPSKAQDANSPASTEKSAQ